jgi:hypothetical protein
VTRIKRLYIPLVLGVVLIAAVVGVASARPNSRPVEQAWRVLAVPSHACIPEDDTEDWDFELDRLECDVAPCFFVCPANFPAAGEQAVGAVNVKRVTMYVYDNDVGGNVTVTLVKTYPPSGGQVSMASAGTSNSPADPQALVDTSIVNNPIYRVQAPYIYLGMGATNARVYGFFIHYTW